MISISYIRRCVSVLLFCRWSFVRWDWEHGKLWIVENWILIEIFIKENQVIYLSCKHEVDNDSQGPPIGRMAIPCILEYLRSWMKKIVLTYHIKECIVQKCSSSQAACEKRPILPSTVKLLSFRYRKFIHNFSASVLAFKMKHLKTILWFNLYRI